MNIPHQMVQVQTFLSGAQEFVCPACGRHFILQWPPDYRQIVLEEGNSSAIHVGSSGKALESSTDDPRLEPYARFLENNEDLKFL